MEISTFLNKFNELSSIPFLRGLVVLVFYLLLAKTVDLLMDKLLKRLAKRTSVSFDDQLILFLHTPVCWTIVFVGMLHAQMYLDLSSPWSVVCPNVVKSLILFVWWAACMRFATWATERSYPLLAKGDRVGQDIFYLFKNILRVLVLIVGILWLLTIWGIDLTPLFASAGIAGIAVALAAKDTLSNFFGGISIFVDKPFKVGDYIILDSSERGEVVNIGIRSTRIKTRDDVQITIPNSILSNAKIINESAPIPRFRIRVPVGVAYGSDLELVEKCLVGIARENPLVSDTPEPRARVRAFADSSINFELLCWVNDPREKGLTLHRLFNEIYRVFEEKNISIPFPQRDVHIYPQDNGLPS